MVGMIIKENRPHERSVLRKARRGGAKGFRTSSWQPIGPATPNISGKATYGQGAVPKRRRSSAAAYGSPLFSSRLNAPGRQCLTDSPEGYGCTVPAWLIVVRYLPMWEVYREGGF